MLGLFAIAGKLRSAQRNPGRAQHRERDKSLRLRSLWVYIRRVSLAYFEDNCCPLIAD